MLHPVSHCKKRLLGGICQCVNLSIIQCTQSRANGGPVTDEKLKGLFHLTLELNATFILVSFCVNCTAFSCMHVVSLSFIWHANFMLIRAFLLHVPLLWELGCGICDLGRRLGVCLHLIHLVGWFSAWGQGWTAVPYCGTTAYHLIIVVPAALINPSHAKT